MNVGRVVAVGMGASPLYGPTFWAADHRPKSANAMPRGSYIGGVRGEMYALSLMFDRRHWRTAVNVEDTVTGISDLPISGSARGRRRTAAGRNGDAAARRGRLAD